MAVRCRCRGGCHQDGSQATARGGLPRRMDGRRHHPDEARVALRACSRRLVPKEASMGDCRRQRPAWVSRWGNARCPAGSKDGEPEKPAARAGSPGGKVAVKGGKVVETAARAGPLVGKAAEKAVRAAARVATPDAMPDAMPSSGFGSEWRVGPMAKGGSCSSARHHRSRRHRRELHHHLHGHPRHRAPRGLGKRVRGWRAKRQAAWESSS